MTVMTDFEYQYLTGTWKGPAGAAYNQTHKFCKGFGWVESFTIEGKPVPTAKGLEAIKNYQAFEDYFPNEENSA